MVEKLNRLNNTLAQIETKGDGTILMAQCRTFIANLINECEQQAKAKKVPADKTEGD